MVPESLSLLDSSGRTHIENAEGVPGSNPNGVDLNQSCLYFSSGIGRDFYLIFCLLVNSNNKK